MLLSTLTLTWVAGHRLTDATIQIASLIQGAVSPGRLPSEIRVSVSARSFAVFLPAISISQGIDRLA